MVQARFHPNCEWSRLSLHEGEPLADYTKYRSIVGALQYPFQLEYRTIVGSLQYSFKLDLLVHAQAHFNSLARCEAYFVLSPRNLYSWPIL